MGMSRYRPIGIGRLSLGSRSRRSKELGAEQQRTTRSFREDCLDLVDAERAVFDFVTFNGDCVEEIDDERLDDRWAE